MDRRHVHKAALWCGPILLLIVMLGVATCANGEKEATTEMPSQDINKVMEAHARELMSIPGVVGLAIGETEDKTPCILVLVKEETDSLKQAIPKIIDGHPTRLLVTGEIKPMEGK